ncbi:hypothetical protein [Marinimicrobium agarilyticum]|uniref:hypothetical protein n=1 Tax=Marinimicrobium agarilyticum TaxID=306546 RepID=UPI000402BCB6|nr:hypothetical protein [Marinimicrobium agarilyticum]
MKRLMLKLVTVSATLFALSVPAYAAQTATGPVTLWSISETPGFSLISVGAAGDGGGASVLCTVDATTVFGAALMGAAATAAIQVADVTLTCSDTGRVQQLQLVAGSD